MKEASGEANLTVVTIILIGVVVAIATPLINSMMKNSTLKSCCTEAGGVLSGNTCTVAAQNTLTQATVTANFNQCKTDAGIQ